ncbi:MAG: AAA family ATPase, partial [Euryarchaeota archaeon]|nr:AAA family ATPase [Euryarchaeota archaeon]
MPNVEHSITSITPGSTTSDATVVGDVKFIITGSSSSLLQKECSSLLTGRVITTEVYPLSFDEYLT